MRFTGMIHHHFLSQKNSYRAEAAEQPGLSSTKAQIFFKRPVWPIVHVSLVVCIHGNGKHGNGKQELYDMIYIYNIYIIRYPCIQLHEIVNGNLTMIYPPTNPEHFRSHLWLPKNHPATSSSPLKKLRHHFSTKRCLLLCNFSWKKQWPMTKINPLHFQKPIFPIKKDNHKAQVLFVFFRGGFHSRTTNKWMLYLLVAGIPPKKRCKEI